MKKAKRFFLIVSILYLHVFVAAARPLPVGQKKEFVFSAVRGTVSKPVIVSVGTESKTKNIKWTGGDSAYFNVELKTSAPGKAQQLIITFQPSPGFIGIAKASLNIYNASGKPVTVISLTGLGTKGLEGENEPALSVVADALGYDINIGWSGLANHSRPELQGDELPFSLFKKASKGKVEMLPVARYSPDFELPFGYYINTNKGPDKKQAGILAKAGKYPENQTLFPAIVSGSDSFDPGENSFGFYTAGPTHTAYSEDVWNMLLHPENAVRAVRTYPLKNKTGRVIKNNYLVCFEEAKNGDYNDYVFVVKNIAPVTINSFTAIFNGINLDGWHTFIKGKEKNADPDNNFKIEDSVLHVMGKDLGYAITEKPYHNYHFKVDFKWGGKKWPPRENAKRDAGVCYNIGLNEPDSIWPASVECQIQEGDVGDFWLLGFTSINVDGKVNQTGSHVQVVKKKDAEKPNGEWNTVEIISYNGTCVHIVNGVVVNYGTGASVKDGRILLQSEYSEVFYRRVKIREL